jgi:hypothetical protein
MFVVVFPINLSTLLVIAKTVDPMLMPVLQQLELQLTVMQVSKLLMGPVFVQLTNLFKQVLLQGFLLV